MAGTRWQQVKALFEEAEGLSAAEREQLLRSVAEVQPEVAREVSSLLAHHDPHQEFLEPPDAHHVARALEQLEAHPRVGRCLGAYRLARLIATGGMGQVFLAARADGQFERQVAVKVIRRALDSTDLRRRFRIEQQVLAGLDHPHIAKLLDGGVTDDGLSYLVMELVEGDPIDAYCTRAGLGLRSRLELFQQVCAAVQYAHQRLVVHRDIKPGNILVTADGVPKLLDFGVAKLVDEDAQTQRTRSQSIPFFTPEYASPEQIRGETITTACDVYALGVVLYQLLTGQSPYAPATDSAHALARAVCEQPPTLPSRADVDPQSPPAQWQRRLKGDLDTIVAMALRKEPDRRYASVEQFLEDIQRHLTGRPVIARKDTFTYRARKFVMRNKLGVISAAALGLAIIAVTVGTSISLLRVRQSQQRTQLINEFLEDTLAQMDVDEAGRELSLRSVLDRASARAAKDLAAYPDVLAGVHSMLGRAYLGQRHIPEARAHLTKALALDRELYGEGAQYAEGLHDLAILEHFAGDDRQALELGERALALQRASVGDDALTASMIGDLGVFQRALGDYAAAEQYYREALALRRRLLPADDQELASGLNNLGVLLRTRGRLAEARTLLEEALAILRRIHGNDNVQVANTLGNLGTLLNAAGELDEAERRLREGLRINRKLLPEGHPRIAITANNLARVLEDKGAYAEAERYYREGLAINRALFGADHPRTATMLQNLAIVLAREGHLDEALIDCREALATRRNAYGAEHENVAVSLDGLGRIQLLRGDAVEAERTLQDALAMRRRVLPEDHPHFVRSYEHLAEANRSLGDLTKAREYAEQALQLERRVGGEGSLTLARCTSLLGGIETALGESAGGRERLAAALGVQAVILGPEHPDTEVTLQRIAENFRNAGDCATVDTFITERTKGAADSTVEACLRIVAAAGCSAGTGPKKTASTGQ
ncbi:MAG: serine/threonine protein kinase [Phycisphaerales bacterium]|nr:serine/threonine protein kinase [Phycisphaerales bacterium]